MTDSMRPDDADQTRRHDLPASEPASEPVIEPLAPIVERYTPQPEPRSDWSRRDDVAATPTQERWYEPAPQTAPVATTATAASGPRNGTGTIVAAALLSAVLASGGTLLALGATGALDRDEPTQTSATGQTVGSARPVTIDESSATIDVAATVSPAVVRITTGDLTPDLGVIPSTGVGSGVIYDSDGWILTNRHVVEGSDEMQVELNDGQVLSGTVYGIDTLTDLAIVKVEATDLPTAAVGSSGALKVGQLVIAIGSPLGTYSNSVTSGIVSATGRSITTDDGQNLNNLIQTDAAINPGNSGGPLLDSAGHLIGVNTQIASPSGASAGVGFAIPVDEVNWVVPELIQHGRLRRPTLGVQLADPSIEQRLKIDGALILAVIGGSGAAEAGLRPTTQNRLGNITYGDIIIAIDGQPVRSSADVPLALERRQPGETVKLKIRRGRAEQEVSVKLAAPAPR